MNRLLLFFLSLALYSVAVFSQTVQTPAEFERNEGVLLVWDYHPARDSVLANVAGAIQDVAKIWIIYYPGSAPVDTTQIRAYLLGKGVGYQNVHFIPAWTETLWIRDFGPLPYYANATGSALRFLDAGYSAYNRPKDDSIPSQLGNYWNIPVTNLPLQLEGGNLIFDGFMRGFGSKRLLDQNAPLSQAQISSTIRGYFGLEDFVFLDKLLNSGGGIWMHVDMYMKMLDHETIMISQLPSFAPDYQLLEDITATIGGLQSTFGRKYNIIRIPVPPKANGNYPTTLNDEMRTYTNSLTINNVVVVPTYNLPMDMEAKQIYESAMPGYDIKMVDAQVLTPLYGAIHCITREVPQAHKLRIRHAKLTRTQLYNNEIPVLFHVYSSNVVDSAFICYRVNNSTEYNRIFVYLSCSGFLSVIPELAATDTVHYYLEAWSQNNMVTFPAIAPNNYFSFWFENTTGTSIYDFTRSLKIMPNPVKDHLVVMIGDQPVMNGEVSLYDVCGKLVFTITLKNKAEIILPASVANGMYVLRLLAPNARANTKLLIER